MLPFSYNYIITSIFTVYVLLNQLVQLYFFIRNEMQGKYEDEAENQELCKAMFLRLCVDCFAFLWGSSGYTALTCMISNQ